MSFPIRKPARRASTGTLLTLAVIGTVGGALGLPATGETTSLPLECALTQSESRLGLTFSGRVTAERPVEGTYKLSITRNGRSGHAVINQSGRFSAAPGAPAELGRATLGGNTSGYDATLEIRWDGKVLTCGDNPIAEISHPKPRPGSRMTDI